MEYTRKRAVIMIVCIAFLISAAFIIIASQSQVHAAGENFKRAIELKKNKEYLKETPNEWNTCYYYKFKTGNASAKYKICFENIGEEELSFRIFDEDRNNMGSSYAEHHCGYGNFFNDCVAAKDDGYILYDNLKRNSWHYLQIYAEYGEKTDYYLEVKEIVDKPSKGIIKKVSAKKKKVKVSWKRAARAKAYQVAIKKGGGKWITKTAISTKYTFKKLKSKKRYSVKVRGYFNYEGKTYYGKWSKIKSVKVK